jgi:hypothetical protein
MEGAIRDDAATKIASELAASIAVKVKKEKAANIRSAITEAISKIYFEYCPSMAC